MKVLVIALLAVGFLQTGCATPKSLYQDPTAVEEVGTTFGSTDLQMIAEKMVDSLLSFPPIVQETAKRRPVMFIERIKNKTSQHIDTESITDTISTKILRSGKFRFVDMDRINAVQEQIAFQKNSGMVSQESSLATGRQIGAEYMLYGNMSSIVKRNSDVKDVYYKFTLKLMHLESGILEWQDEKEIRKTQSRRTFGR